MNNSKINKLVCRGQTSHMRRGTSQWFACRGQASQYEKFTFQILTCRGQVSDNENRGFSSPRLRRLNFGW